jgi:hypothetical protein
MEKTLKKPGERTLKVILMTHVEGDEVLPEDNPRCGDLHYQTAGLPELGVSPTANTYEIDVTGTELMYETLQNYHDSLGKTPKLFIEPVASFWHTEGDPKYGGKLFRKYDFLSLGCELGIQTHNVYYVGEGYGWAYSSATKQGIWRRLVDMHTYAERVYHNGKKVNGGMALTGGHKNVCPPMDLRDGEYLIDHTAHFLGYRISFEDFDGHWQSKPESIDPKSACPFAYVADYGDGVRMLKIDFNGMITSDSPRNTPRSEHPEEALARLDKTLEAQQADNNPAHLYYFATTFHSNVFWIDHHLEKSGTSMHMEGAGLKAFMDGVQARVEAGAKIEYLTPSELLREYNDVQPSDKDRI